MRRGGNQLMDGRGLLVAVIVAIGWLWTGSGAWADTLIDTTACPTNGAANVSSPSGPLEQNEWGNIFVAPTGYLKTFTADLAADGNQAATLALYNAKNTGPFGPAVWSGPATIQSTGSTSTFEPQTFTVDQPLNPNQTYAFAIASGTPTATTWWAEGHATPGSPCAPGAVVDRSVGQQDWLPPLANEAFSFKADFLTASPPVASPSPIVFHGQIADTIGDVQAVTISSPGQVTITLGQLRLSGQNGSDFVIVEDQCSGQTLAPAASCTAGVRFGPQRTGPAARSGTLEIPYTDGTNPPSGAANPPLGAVTDSLSGTEEPASAGPTGPAGPPGPAGRSGANGKIELVTCTKTTKTIKVHGHQQHVSQQHCTTTLVSGPVKFTTTANTSATITRAGVVYATGYRSGSRLVLVARRATRPGRYTLTEHRGRLTTRQAVTIR